MNSEVSKTMMDVTQSLPEIGRDREDPNMHLLLECTKAKACKLMKNQGKKSFHRPSTINKV
jgi:hypothetical protein